MAEESNIQRDGIKTLENTPGLIVLRLNSGKVPVRGGWMQLCPAGTPDIVVFSQNGRVGWAETKRPKGKNHEAGYRSDEQIEFERRVRNFGHLYCIPRSAEDFVDFAVSMLK